MKQYNKIIYSIKSVVVKQKIYIDFSVESNIKKTKYKGSDHVKIWKYQSIFSKGYTLKEVFVIKKLKIQYHGHMWWKTLMTVKIIIIKN